MSSPRVIPVTSRAVPVNEEMDLIQIANAISGQLVDIELRAIEEIMVAFG
jgi:hypothetical protein